MSNGTSCSPIASAGAQTYLAANADVGSALRVLVTASNKNGTAASTSDATSPITTATTSTTSTTSTTASTSTTSTTTSTSATTTTTTPTTTTTTSTTPTTTTTPTTNGTVGFYGGWESGDISQWTWGAQCANYGISSDSYSERGNLFIVNDVVGQGNYAGRFDLPAASTKTSACEVLRKRPAAPGSDDYYGLMVRFPTNWREPSSTFWGMVIAQFNFEGIIGPPVGLFAHGNHVNLVMQSGYVQNNASTYSTGNDLPGTISVPGGIAAIPAPMALGVWHELVVHVHWATDSSGAVEAWHRLKGEVGWERTVAYGGYPTLQWDATHPISWLSSVVSSDKIGAYRGASTTPLSVWHDGFCVGSTFAAAASCL